MDISFANSFHKHVILYMYLHHSLKYLKLEIGLATTSVVPNLIGVFTLYAQVSQ